MQTPKTLLFCVDSSTSKPLIKAWSSDQQMRLQSFDYPEHALVEPKIPKHNSPSRATPLQGNHLVPRPSLGWICVDAILSKTFKSNPILKENPTLVFLFETHKVPNPIFSVTPNLIGRYQP